MVCAIKADDITSNFQKLSSTNFTWSILECFVSNNTCSSDAFITLSNIQDGELLQKLLTAINCVNNC